MRMEFPRLFGAVFSGEKTLAEKPHVIFVFYGLFTHANSRRALFISALQKAPETFLVSFVAKIAELLAAPKDSKARKSPTRAVAGKGVGLTRY